jgi:DNA-binding MarR family transcriptional regulator
MGFSAPARVVRLTAAGVNLTDQLIEEHLANEADILRGLTDSDHTALERLLATLTRTIESTQQSRDLGMDRRP